jgi:acetyl/propionyl-CoA carboxylase alpha subunit
VRYVVESAGERHDIEVGPDGVTLDGQQIPASLTATPGSPVQQLTIGDTVHRIIVRRGSARGDYTILIDGERVSVEALDARTRAIRDLTAAAAGPTGPAPLIAPMPGMIVRVAVAVGDAVVAGQGLVVMEAMKNELRAAGAGTVVAVRAVPGTAVQKGAVLIELA